MKLKISKKPKVSIACITYNQAKYIGQTLDSFLMQKTNFDYEILINDDCSTDGTVEILQHYAAKHKNIKLNLQKENLYSKGMRGMFVRFLLPKAKGEYIALCEGDDFWTDPDKLQNQVDYMDKHSNCALSFHRVTVHFDNGDEKDSVFPDKDKSFFTPENLIRENYMQTNSVMYKNLKDYSKVPTDLMPGDWFLHLYHAKFGKIGFVDKNMAVYRRHPDGIWWDSYNNPDKFWEKNGLYLLKFNVELQKLYKGKEVYDYLDKQINFIFDRLAELGKSNKSEDIYEAVKLFPSSAGKYTISQAERIEYLEGVVSGLEKELSGKNKSRKTG